MSNLRTSLSGLSGSGNDGNGGDDNNLSNNFKNLSGLYNVARRTKQKKRTLENNNDVFVIEDDEFFMPTTNNAGSSSNLTFNNNSNLNIFSSTNLPSSTSFYSTGSNVYGMIGQGESVGDKIQQFTKIEHDVITPKNVKLIACGHYHIILITKNNEVFVCGKNSYGQLGYRSTSKNIYTFTQITLPQNLMEGDIVDVKCGRYHTIFITDHAVDNVWVCGKNKTGQMSLPTINVIHFVPIKMPGIMGKASFAACGSEYTFIKTTIGLFACGDNSRGQLGVGLDAASLKSLRVVSAPAGFIHKNVISIDCGEFHTLFMTSTGEIWGCGTTVNGQLGFEPPKTTNKPNVNVPVKVTLLPIGEEIKTVRCGFHHSAFLTESGKVYVTGRNGDGQLSLGDSTPRVFKFTQVQISESNLSSHFVKDLYCYSYYTILITDKNEMFLAGSNKCGQLGTSDLTRLDKFTRVFNRRVNAVYCGRDSLMIECEDSDISVEDFTESFGKLLDFDNPHNQHLFDAEIICSDGVHIPICFDFVVYRVGVFNQFETKEVAISPPSNSNNNNSSPLNNNNSNMVIEGGTEEETDEEDADLTPELLNDGAGENIFDDHNQPPLKKRKQDKLKSNNTTTIRRRIIDLSSSLSSKAVKQILKFVYTDILSEDSAVIDDLQLNLTTLVWIAEKSNNNNSDAMTSTTVGSGNNNSTTNSIDRLVKFILKNTLNIISKETVVQVLESLQEFKSHPLLESLYKHCIAFIKKTEKISKFSDINNHDKLSRELLMELLLEGEKYYYLEKSDITIPPSTFHEDLKKLYRDTQINKDKMGDVTLLLDRDGKQIIKAHRAILSAKSDFFKLKFSSGMSDMTASTIEIYDTGEDSEIEAQRNLIEFLYTEKVEVDSSNAVGFLELWSFYGLDVHHPVCKQCQEIVINGLTAENVLDFQKSFVIDRNSPYPALVEACKRALVKFWVQINERHTKEELMQYLTYDEYLSVTKTFLASSKIDFINY